MRFVLVSYLAFAVAGCGAAAGDPAAGQPTSPAPGATSAAAPATNEPGTPPPPPTPGAPDCAGRVKLAGDFTWSFELGGRTRTANVHVPLAYDPSKRTPLVVNAHGYTDTAEGQASLSKMTETADANGFVVLHPQGVANSWNAGACCGTAMSSELDDVAFVGKLLDEAEAKLCVDPKRVFASGMSNGGFLAHRLACELDGRVAAVGSVAGLMTLAECAPKRAVPVLQFHGTSDYVVPYRGSISLGFPAVEDVVDAWAKRDGCTGAPTETYAKGDVTCVTHASCKDNAEVTLCTVEGGGHTWPGGMPVPALGKTSTAISASDALWSFFQKHPMP